MLNISPDYQFEDSLIDEGVAALGSPKSGKSNFIRVLVEEVGDRLPLTIFDVHGEYYTLNEKFEFLRVGKGHDVNLEVTSDQAAEIAEFSFNNNVSVIVDMLLMDEDEQTKFVFNYCYRLWTLNLLRKKAYGLILEEAQIFIPQQGKQTDALKWMKKIALEGRKFGFKIVLSTQRVAEINKSVLDGCRSLFFHGVFLPNDIKVYQNFLPYEPAETKRLTLGLQTGEAIYRDGRETRIIKTRLSTTTRVGNTPGMEPENVVLNKPNMAMLEQLQKQFSQAAASADETGSPSPSIKGAPIVSAGTAISLEVANELAQLRKENAELKTAKEKLQKKADDALKESERQKGLLQVEVAKNKNKVVRKSYSLPGVEIEGKIEKNGSVKITRQTTHVETVERTYQSSRQIAIRTKAQEEKFIKLLLSIQGLRTNCVAILLEALCNPKSRIQLGQVARQYDYALSNIGNGLPKLLATGLIQRSDNGVVQSSADAYLISEFPELNISELRQRLMEAVEERLDGR